MAMRAVYVLLVWLIAAAIVTATRGMLPLQIAVILAAGLGYTRFTARNASVQHGLGVGVIWATLCIVAEIGLNVPLLGGPGAHQAFRNLLLLTWIAAPALMARRRHEVTTGA
jgi:hypothetical protein